MYIKGIRLLGLVRMWRLLRMISTMLNKKNAEMDKLMEKWNEDKEVMHLSFTCSTQTTIPDDLIALFLLKTHTHTLIIIIMLYFQP